MYDMMYGGWGGWEAGPLAWTLMGFGMGFFVIFALWSVFWKGLALWHSAKRHQPWWFVILLVINTAGILEIIYLFAIAKKKPSELFK